MGGDEVHPPPHGSSSSALYSSPTLDKDSPGTAYDEPPLSGRCSFPISDVPLKEKLGHQLFETNRKLAAFCTGLKSRSSASQLKRRVSIITLDEYSDSFCHHCHVFLQGSCPLCRRQRAEIKMLFQLLSFLGFLGRQMLPSAHLEGGKGRGVEGGGEVLLGPCSFSSPNASESEVGDY